MKINHTHIQYKDIDHALEELLKAQNQWERIFDKKIKFINDISGRFLIIYPAILFVISCLLGIVFKFKLQQEYLLYLYGYIAFGIVEIFIYDRLYTKEYIAQKFLLEEHECYSYYYEWYCKTNLNVDANTKRYSISKWNKDTTYKHFTPLMFSLLLIAGISLTFAPTHLFNLKTKKLYIIGALVSWWGIGSAVNSLEK